jgi:hypothetical protein
MALWRRSLAGVPWASMLRDVKDCQALDLVLQRAATIGCDGVPLKSCMPPMVGIAYNSGHYDTRRTQAHALYVC